MSEQISDPGYGTGPGRGGARILRRDGTLNVVRKGERFHPSDVYHLALNTTWTRFTLSAIGIYMLANIGFACIYMLIGIDNIAGAHSNGFWPEFADAAYFSAQTLTTVGYGVLSPDSALVSIVAGFEAMFGLLLFGVFTGLSFGRFSRIKPRISFSDNAIIAPYRNNTNALMFRLANERAGAIMNANISVILVTEVVGSKNLKRQFYNLDLELKQIRSLALSWTVVHPITEDSPLLKLRTEDLIDANAEIVIVMEAFDDTVGQTFYARKSYVAADILAAKKFVPMFYPGDGRTVELNLGLLSSVEDAELFVTDIMPNAGNLE